MKQLQAYSGMTAYCGHCREGDRIVKTGRFTRGVRSIYRSNRCGREATVVFVAKWLIFGNVPMEVWAVLPLNQPPRR